MATWDGSYSGPDDQNYYVYSDQNESAPAAPTWTYFPDNVSNDYLQSNRDFYAQNEPIFEHNNPAALYRSNANIVPNLLANAYPQHVANPIDETRVLNSQEYSSNIKPEQYVPENSWKQDYDPRKSKTQRGTFAKGVREVASNAGNAGNASSVTMASNATMASNVGTGSSCSKLHVSAEEFVPHSRELEEKKQEPSMLKPIDGTNSFPKDSSGVPDKHFSCNASRYERKYNSRRGSYERKPKEEVQDQYYRRNWNSYSQQQQQQQGKALHKFQGSKYFANKHYSGKSQANPRNLSGDAMGESTVSNAAACSNKIVSTANSVEGEVSASLELDSSKNKSTTNEDPQQESINPSNMQANNGKQSSGQAKEFAYYNSSSKQSYGNYRNVRKYQYNGRYGKEESSYKERRRRYPEYSRENYSKEGGKFRGKDQGYSNEECNKFREHSNEETESEAKEAREKRHNHQGYNELKEHVKESKTGILKEKDKGKSYGEARQGNENWRSKREGGERNYSQKRSHNKRSTVDDDASQRERLTDQLNRGQLECLVCCEYIKQNDYVWSCSNCYHVLHLKCTKKWAKSSQAENGWRCPACQNVNLVIPEDYFCFCGKMRTPEWNRRDVAHSCGEVCSRTLSKNTCPHKCTLLCHPGSCPQCTAMVTRYCGCGKTSQTVQCSTHKLLLCDAICGKDLNCGKHKCESTCHHGQCVDCEKTITQECYCGKNTREVTCQSNVSLTYSCETVCGKLLECGNHACTKLCHEDACEPCSLTPEKITTCCCGQTPLTDRRQSCLDPIPVCDKICSKNLKCGQPNNPHKCKAKCHEGDCPVCDLTTDVKCRCGNMDREISCKDLTSKADDARCEKRCTKKRSCGKHKCNQLCCIEIEHVCPLICSKTLSCGRHKCEQSCHKGRCQACWRSSFEELYCECGASVIYPPVPCGTRRPTCERPCSRQHNCGHEVLHNCHSEVTCPPCSVLTQRWCHGRHELRKAVPCYVNEISCGLPCNKPISCGRHKCITICHSGPCEKPGQQCWQPCVNLRELCEHICAAPCHDGKCPDIPCREMIRVTCQCGHRSMFRACAENSKEYQRIASSILASKMADMQLGHSINLEEVFGQGAKKQNQLKTLECNDECKLIERNRRLALGLQIVNPDLSGKLMPRYSEYMKQWAKKDPHFCQMVHEKLTELVQLAKTSKQKSRSYSFDSMNKDKRHFVHESCEHFGCESHAYDQEPKRNVVATAVKDKSWLPSYSLLEIVQRENGQRKVPGPMLNTSKTDGSVKATLSLPAKKSQKPESPTSIKTYEPEIDYFDYQG